MIQHDIYHLFFNLLWEVWLSHGQHIGLWVKRLQVQVQVWMGHCVLLFTLLLTTQDLHDMETTVSSSWMDHLD